jgi:two-component system response regulator HydG
MKHNENSALRGTVGESGGGERWLRVEELAAEGERVGQLVGRSELMRGVFAAIRWLGPYKTTVLIQGESGTGKELVARALHSLGPTPKGPFVVFNCSNLVETLAESQLFGHVRGAFTDAREELLGCFRAAHGGTLFLDEIGEMPLKLQAKLLRAVESYEVQPVGAAHSYRVNIRLLVATNRDLRQLVKEQGFRADLFYRLNATSITMPPLRHHREDIALLAAHFITHYNRLFDKHVCLLAQSALELLLAYPWPGNVRELAHAIEHALLFAPHDRIDPSHLPAHLTQTTPTAADVLEQAPPPNLVDNSVSAGGLSLHEVMKDTLLRSLQKTGGNRRRAASLLGVSRSTLYRMLDRYGVGNVGREATGVLDGHENQRVSSPNAPRA